MKKDVEHEIKKTCKHFKFGQKTYSPIVQQYKDVDEVAIAPIVIPEYVQITLHLDNSDCLSFRSAKLAD